MNNKKIIHAPIVPGELELLEAGDVVYLSGTIYTGRDAAHKRLVKMLEEGKKIPIELTDQVIYYVGPCPAKPGNVIGPCGPTSSYRMDDYAPLLLDKGLKAIIGKGPMADKVVDAIKKNKASYFAGIGGAAALISKCVRKAELVAFEDLGTEAIRRLEVVEMPLIVAIDSNGNNLYETGPAMFRMVE